MAYLLACVLIFFSFSNARSQERGSVVVTLKPLHSLVSGVMGTTGNPDLVVAGHDSPHEIHLKPSQIQKLQSASVLFYLAPNFETFLQRVIHILPSEVRRVSVIQAVDFPLLKRRSGGVWNRDMGSDKRRSESAAEADMHVWLDPKNAQRIVSVIVRELSAVFPENRLIYEANGRSLIEKLESLDIRLANALLGMKNKGFIVAHDAYGYFEERYGLYGVGALTFDPDNPPSPKTLHSLRDVIKEGKVTCIFQEPGFSAQWISAVREGSRVHLGILDPEGVTLSPGPEFYETLMENLVHNFKACFDHD
jgi:zinc transport system substrate-binding protein